VIAIDSSRVRADHLLTQNQVFGPRVSRMTYSRYRATGRRDSREDSHRRDSASGVSCLESTNSDHHADQSRPVSPVVPLRLSVPMPKEASLPHLVRGDERKYGPSTLSVYRKYRELKANSGPGHHGRNVKLFLSHAASDEHIALLLKAEIEGRLRGVKVFCSGDPTDLPPGDKWSPTIQLALEDATMLIFVTSERSLQRPWVWFECGTFWFTKKKIMPLCLGAVRKNALPPPLSELQAINGDESSDLKTALDVVAAATGISLSDDSNLHDLAEKLKQLDNKAAAVLSIASGWRGVIWNGKFLAYDGPYENLDSKEDRPFESSMQDVLKAGGYIVALYDKRHFREVGDKVHFVWLTDKTSWKCRIARGADYLVASPT
jgi:TIR domain